MNLCFSLDTPICSYLWEERMGFSLQCSALVGGNPSLRTPFWSCANFHRCETMTKCNTMENTGLMILVSHEDHLDHIFSWCKPALTPLASLERCQIYTTEELWPSVPLQNPPCLLSHRSTNCTWTLCYK